MLTYGKWKLYKVSRPVEGVLHIAFDRPNSLNAVNTESWRQFAQIFDQAERDPDVRAIVLSGEGKSFCAGLDVKAAAQDLMQWDGMDMSRVGVHKFKYIKEFQEAITKPFTVSKPVIAAIHGHCIGLGVDISCSCDIRYASKDAKFSIREVDIGMAADMGSLQLGPKVVTNLGWFKEAAYTGRIFDCQEALVQGLVDRMYDDKRRTINQAVEVAQIIASKSPVAVHGTKKSINYSLDHNLKDGLDQIAEFNAYGAGDDLMQGASAAMMKQKPKYAKL